MDRILILHLTRHWFNLIDCGKKIVEYRWYNDYWIPRIMKSKEEMHTHVKLIEGYQKNARYMIFEILRIDVVNDKTDLGIGKQFAFNLGKLICKGNLGD